ncbi:hypothetical protein SAMN04515660_2511 [Luteibacter sp. 329MFSha]|nr:hypothetical protein [Luteibacter sp. 3190]SEW14310.1 hypothetical protein SAMN04515660_2511 [Luteibacter sp. 329MFSha]
MRARRAMWFVALYLGGVAAVTLVAGLLKLLVPR